MQNSTLLRVAAVLGSLVEFQNSSALPQKFEALRVPTQRTEKIFNRIFQEQRERYLEALDEVRQDSERAILDPYSLSHRQIQDLENYASELRPGLERNVYLALVEGRGQFAGGFLNKGRTAGGMWETVGFQLENPRAVKAARDWAGDMITRVDQTTKDQVNSLVTYHMSSGNSPDELARSLQKSPIFSRKRAHRIAVFEMGDAYELGQYSSAIEFVEAGISLEKMWLTAGDAKVREEHREFEKLGWVDFEYVYPGNYPASRTRCPTDPGCRCTLLYQPAVVEPPERIVDEEFEFQTTQSKASLGVNGENEAQRDVSTFFHDPSYVQPYPAYSADQKIEICEALLERTGGRFTDSQISEFIHQWAESSNDEDMRSLLIQKDASELFGFPLSPWQATKIQQMNLQRSIVRSEENGRRKRQGLPPLTDAEFQADYPGFFSLFPSDQQKILLRAMYDYTQSEFDRTGVGRYLRLYRGVRVQDPDQLGITYDSEGRPIITYSGNVLESWSRSLDVADQFASGWGDDDLTAVILEAYIDRRSIIGTCRTGFGCLEEQEFVTIANQGQARIQVFTRPRPRWGDEDEEPAPGSPMFLDEEPPKTTVKVPPPHPDTPTAVGPNFDSFIITDDGPVLIGQNSTGVPLKPVKGGPPPKMPTKPVLPDHPTAEELDKFHEEKDKFYEEKDKYFEYYGVKSGEETPVAVEEEKKEPEPQQPPPKPIVYTPAAYWGSGTSPDGIPYTFTADGPVPKNDPGQPPLKPVGNGPPPGPPPSEPVQDLTKPLTKEEAQALSAAIKKFNQDWYAWHKAYKEYYGFA